MKLFCIVDKRIVKKKSSIGKCRKLSFRKIYKFIQVFIYKIRVCRVKKKWIIKIYHFSSCMFLWFFFFTLYKWDNCRGGMYQFKKKNQSIMLILYIIIFLFFYFLRSVYQRCKLFLFPMIYYISWVYAFLFHCILAIFIIVNFISLLIFWILPPSMASGCE